ncbi:MAG: PTS sugar transporter subunit IIC, partial [Clostridia bacterium]|nr:PTS sugar transporter subunit IIC [Clostridia bacterium]
VFKIEMYGAAINSGMGTCGLLGPISVIIGWFGGVYERSVTAFDWIGLILICFVIPTVLAIAFGALFRKIGWIKENDLKL